MTDLAGMNPRELADWCKEQGLPAFRGKQIFQWIHQGADFDEMTNLPLSLRQQLRQTAVAQPVSIIEERKSRIDDTVKFTDAACMKLIKVPRIFLPTALRGCVKWARENNVTLITAEHMDIINDKRAKEKSR